jgi:hypothetical protein
MHLVLLSQEFEVIPDILNRESSLLGNHRVKDIGRLRSLAVLDCLEDEMLNLLRRHIRPLIELGLADSPPEDQPITLSHRVRQTHQFD